VDTVATPMSGSSLAMSPGVSTNGAPGMAGPGGFGNPAASPSPAAAANANAVPSHMVFLRQVPRDPFFPDQSVPPEQQWNLRAYGALPGDFSGGADVYDVSSKSEAIGRNGIAYKDW